MSYIWLLSILSIVLARSFDAFRQPMLTSTRPVRCSRQPAISASGGSSAITHTDIVIFGPYNMRIQDNPLLQSTHELLPVFLYDKDMIEELSIDAHTVDRCLRDLETNFALKGAKLTILYGKSDHMVCNFVKELMETNKRLRSTNVTVVYTHSPFEPVH